MTLKLRVYPDPILTKVSELVTDFGDELKTFCEQLFVCMKESNGVGLSAVQVGRLEQIIVMHVPGCTPKIIINPEIIEASEETFNYSEGCLSVPGFYDDRDRPFEIKLKYQHLDGSEITDTFHHLEAFCIQHEMDHLEGKLFIDDLSPLKKSRIRKIIDKTIRRNKNGK